MAHLARAFGGLTMTRPHRPPWGSLLLLPFVLLVPACAPNELGDNTPGQSTADTPSTTGDSNDKACAHPICSTGSKLSKSCDPCVTEICDQDSYCCYRKWDAQCVGEVGSICGQ